jgi:hypothetical protein
MREEGMRRLDESLSKELLLKHKIGKCQVHIDLEKIRISKNGNIQLKSSKDEDLIRVFETKTD